MSKRGQVPIICRGVVMGCLVALVIGCSPAQKLAKYYGVSKRTLEKDLIVVDKSGQEKVNRREKPYQIWRRDVSALSKDTSLHELIAPMRERRFYGPFLQGDSTVYYYRKLQTTSKEYADIGISQIHQPFGMGDATFQRYLDTIKNRTIRDRIDLRQALEDYQPKEGPKVGLVMDDDQVELGRLKPEIIKFIQSGQLFECTQTPKADVASTTYLELIQKRSSVRVVDHYAFVTVFVSKPMN